VRRIEARECTDVLVGEHRSVGDQLDITATGLVDHTGSDGDGDGGAARDDGDDGPAIDDRPHAADDIAAAAAAE
jgi:hypothetical protein